MSSQQAVLRGSVPVTIVESGHSECLVADAAGDLGIVPRSWLDLDSRVCPEPPPFTYDPGHPPVSLSESLFKPRAGQKAQAQDQ